MVACMDDEHSREGAGILVAYTEGLREDLDLFGTVAE